MVRDVGLLQAGVARPMACVFGEDAYATLAAALASALAFLHLNHHRSMATQDELLELMISMSTGLDDVTVIDSRLCPSPIISA